MPDDNNNNNKDKGGYNKRCGLRNKVTITQGGTKHLSTQRRGQQDFTGGYRGFLPRRRLVVIAKTCDRRTKGVVPHREFPGLHLSLRSSKAFTPCCFDLRSYDLCLRGGGVEDVVVVMVDLLTTDSEENQTMRQNQSVETNKSQIIADVIEELISNQLQLNLQ